MQELTLCYHKNSKRTGLFWKEHLLSFHMAKTGYKFFFQSKVTFNLVWHNFRHIFANFLLTSAKFQTVNIFFGMTLVPTRERHYDVFVTEIEMRLTHKLISECTSNSNFLANHEENENDQDNKNHPDNENEGGYPSKQVHVQSQ